MEALSLHSNSSPLVTFQIQSPPRKSWTLNAEKIVSVIKRVVGLIFWYLTMRGENLALFGDAKRRKAGLDPAFCADAILAAAEVGPRSCGGGHGYLG
jgi:hypothetical protein